MLNLDNQERAFIYQWMGSLLSKELTQEQLSYYQNGHFDSLFELLGEMGFSQQVDALRNALKSLQYDQLELAADFTHCFLLEGSLSAIPYMSAYLQDEELSKALSLVDSYMQHYKLKVNKAQNEPSDHIGVLLSIFIKLIEDQNNEKQKEFAQIVLLSWMDLFQQQSQKVKLKSQFYPSLIELFVLFLKKDIQ